MTARRDVAIVAGMGYLPELLPQTATDLMAKGWQWRRCEDGASVWLDSGGAEVRLDGCAP